MKPNFDLLIIVIIVSGFFHLGAILKKEDHIAAAQTDPILYDKKMEELKDGEKGPSMPKIEYYKKADFLTTAPVANQDDELLPGEEAMQLNEPQAGLPEEVGGQEKENSDEYWWIEEGEGAADAGGRTLPGEKQGSADKSGNENSLKESAEGDDWLD